MRSEHASKLHVRVKRWHVLRQNGVQMALLLLGAWVRGVWVVVAPFANSGVNAHFHDVLEGMPNNHQKRPGATMSRATATPNAAKVTVVPIM